MKRSTRNKACMAASCHPCKYNITPPSTAYGFPPFNSTPAAALPIGALMPAVRNRRPFREEDLDSPADPHTSDDFRMFEFKVRPCNRGRSHAWTDCPFAHPGEKARRRDPRRHNYYPDPCLDFRAIDVCPRGDGCPFSHGVFECWLHPARYRTQLCRDGRSCCRKVCFFAHSPGQLRPLSEAAASSPRSTLVGSLSHFAPPVTPLWVNYKVLFEKIVSSLEAMELLSVSPGSFRTSGSGNVVLFSPPPNLFSRRMKGEDVAAAGDDGCPDLDWVEELLM